MRARPPPLWRHCHKLWHNYILRRDGRRRSLPQRHQQGMHMVRVCQCKCGKAARNYYTKADYYLDRQELAGRWGGAAIAMLGLKPGGEVAKQPFDLLCENRHPVTGERLTVRQKDKRTSGYDINFHCSKSVSLLYAMTGDPDLLAAFRWAVDQTMRSMEARMRTRVRKGGQCFDRLAGNMGFATFVHLTARPVLGVPDPHLHAHAYCFNAVFDPVEGRFKAGQFREIKQQAPRFQALFRSLFAARLADLGFPIEWKGENFEIAGFSPALLKKFSRRTQLIEAEAGRLGIITDALKDQLGAKTREKKQTDATMPELRAGWWERMTDEERNAIAKAALRQRHPLPAGDRHGSAYRQVHPPAASSGRAMIARLRARAQAARPELDTWEQERRDWIRQQPVRRNANSRGRAR